jgi:hypothetical protein
MVWDKTCIDSVLPSEHLSLEAPLGADGKPDMRHAYVRGVLVTFRTNCGRIEIRHQDAPQATGILIEAK